MAFLSELLLLSLLVTAQAVTPFARSRRHLSETCPGYSFTALDPTITHAPVLDLQWVGDNDQTVFAVTHKYASEVGGLWRSDNAGDKFEDLTAKLNETAAGSEPFSVLAIFSQKSSPGNVLVLGTGSYCWFSHDFGKTFTAKPNGGGWRGSGVRSMKMHPRVGRDNWLLLLVKRPSCKTLDKAIMECPYDLMLNKDAFNPESIWLNLTANANGNIAGFVDFDWGASLCPSRNCPDLPDISDDLILATTYARPGDYDQPWDKDVNFVTSTDLFASSTTRVRCGNMFEVVGRSVYLALANSCPVDLAGNPRPPSPYPQGITLYTSMDGGSSFVQACLPVALDQDGYELVETHDGRGAVVIVDFSVDTGFMKLPASSVYTAGPHHALFSLSLTNVYHAEFGTTTDFTRVEGVPGIYISNQMLPWAPGEGQGSTQFPGMDPDMAAYTYYDSLYEYDLEDLTENPLVETRITFNGGGRWQRIPAPTSFPHASCNLCQADTPCYLHLHGLSDWDNIGIALPAVYSNPAAPGLIMATGNVAPLGLGLDRDAGICTFLSLDGGVSWSEVGEGAYIYEFADWGGVIVMARHPGEVLSGPGAAAEELLFSMDYGACWRSVPLKVPLLVDNIRIEPDGQRARVIVHGRACRNTTNPKCAGANITDGLMYVLDVERLMTPEGWGKCASEDFQTWRVPLNAKDSNTPRCVLGEQLTLTRRQAVSRCFQGADYVRPPPTTSPCNCTQQLDTECEYGFIRANDTCVALPADRMPTCPVIDAGTYTVSDTHRRLVHGDKCLNPESIMPDTGGTGKSKTGSGGGGSDDNGGGGSGRSSRRHGGGWVGWLVAGLVLAVLGGLVLGWWQYRASEEQRDTVRELAGSAAANAAALWGLMVDKIGDLVSRLRHGRSGAPGGGGPSGEELGYFQPLGDPGYDVEGRGNVFTLK